MKQPAFQAASCFFETNREVPAFFFQNCRKSVQFKTLPSGAKKAGKTEKQTPRPRGYFHIRRSGGLGPGIEFRGKIGGKVQSSSPNKRKNLGSSVTTRRKNWERITILGTFGVISEIQRAKFGVSVTYIFGGKIWGSDMNFRGKIWGQAFPTSLYGSTLCRPAGKWEPGSSGVMVRLGTD